MREIEADLHGMLERFIFLEWYVQLPEGLTALESSSWRFPDAHMELPATKKMSVFGVLMVRPCSTE